MTMHPASAECTGKAGSRGACRGSPHCGTGSRAAITDRDAIAPADLPARRACGRARVRSIIPRMKQLAFVLVLAACGSKAAAPSSDTTPAKGAEAPPALPDVPFAQLDHGQRIEFMKQKVMPTMKPIFQKHDAKRYADFGCATCHGEQANQGHFDMPNAGLPKIGRTKEFYARFKPEDLQWMGQDVMPTMAGLVGLPPSFTDPAPKDGFGCGNCHTFDPTEQPAAAP
jgi:hypothetical protein